MYPCPPRLRHIPPLLVAYGDGLATLRGRSLELDPHNKEALAPPPPPLSVFRRVPLAVRYVAECVA